MTYIKNGLVSMVNPMGAIEHVAVEDVDYCLHIGYEVVCAFD